MRKPSQTEPSKRASKQAMKDDGVAPSSAPATGINAASGLEVRAWVRLNPQGDAYSPRTGHTVTSNGALALRQPNQLNEWGDADATYVGVQTAVCMCSAARIGVVDSRISSSSISVGRIAAIATEAAVETALDNACFGAI